jgi:diguanylate cyclase (GGDEF)-like protein
VDLDLGGLDRSLQALSAHRTAFQGESGHDLLLNLDNEIARAKRLGDELCCLMLDIDHFKKINDTYGHQCGDEVLRQLGKVLQQAVRHYDIVARYGGEEFVVILPGINIEQAFETAERLRKDIAACAVTCGEAGEVRFSVSIGISSLPRLTGNLTDMLIRDADIALYRAKNAGRNRTAVSADLTGAQPEAAP